MDNSDLDGRLSELSKMLSILLHSEEIKWHRQL